MTKALTPLPPPPGAVFVRIMGAWACSCVPGSLALLGWREPALPNRGGTVGKSIVLKISLDQGLCQGHNRCKQVAPDLFSLDEYGMASVIGDGKVPADQHEQARLAQANCPEFAISLTEQPDGDSK
ncbi:MAG: ferredoxin [Quisquiliibacterium sp.]